MDSDRRSGYGQYQDNVHSSNPRASYASNGPPVLHARTEYASQGYANTSPNHGRTDSYARGDVGGYGRNSYAQAEGAGYARPRMSREALTDSYQDTSKAEEFGASQGWDVYSDFNNTGPRYASIKTGNDGYQEIPSPTPGNASVKSPLVPLDKNTGPNAPVELVTVPALGAEWKAEELRAMTKKGRKEDREYERGKKWKAWWRDDYALCGGWGTRRAIVWTLFAACIITGILLAFLVPRVPKFDYDVESPLVNSTAPEQDGPKFGSFPASFLFNASLNLEVDTNSNFLPLKFNKLHGEVADLDTGRVIAEGELDGYTIPAKAYTKVLLPLNFNYTAANTSDTTWANVYNACRNKNQFINGTRPGINLSVAITMDIAGLVTKAATSRTMTGVPCPFELSPNAS